MARKKEAEDSVIIDAAKAIGSVAGKIASLAGATADRPQSVKAKKGKLPKKNKSRLPRREKKAQQKARASGRPPAAE